MSCNTCNNNHQTNQCPLSLSFDYEGTNLVPSCGGAPLRPLDLQPLVHNAETNTSLKLDVGSKSLVYSSEGAINETALPDTILLTDIANLFSLKDLNDVNYSVATPGDIILYDFDLGWTSYTIPSGTIAVPVGVDGDGKLVKSGSGGAPPAPDTVPLGGIIMWPGDISDIPVSYRRCNGAALNRSVYPDLFTLIGTKYGAGDGSTTFNIPNLNERVPVGLSESNTAFDTLGKTGGSQTNNLQHSHTVNSHNHSEGNVLTGSDSTNHTHNVASGSGGVISTSGVNNTHAHAYTRSAANRSPGTSANLGSSVNNMPPFVTLLYVMRVI